MKVTSMRETTIVFTDIELEELYFSIERVAVSSTISLLKVEIVKALGYIPEEVLK